MKDINQSFSTDNIKEYRFCRVIWGIICAAFLLAATIRFHLLQEETPVSKDVMDNLYVDNLASGVHSVEYAKSYYDEVKRIFNDAGMNMCKWSTNNKSVMKLIKDEDQSKEKELKVLGMLWNIEEDNLGLGHVKSSMLTNKITKRNMLQLIASVYDPLGIVCPVVIRMKKLIQELWKKRVDWDDDVPEAIKRSWCKLTNDLSWLPMVKIQRFIDSSSSITNGNKTYELVTFTDASKHAYATVVYLRVIEGDVANVNLIFAKSRLSPIKEISIPHLELLGVLIGCRASAFVATELKIKNMKQILLTDSKCVIDWFRSERELDRFVINKIKEIRTYDINIGHVSSEDNPADIASRGESACKLVINKKWWKGPEWLSINDNTLQPQTYEINKEILNAAVNEEKGSKILYEVGLVTSDVNTNGPLGINEEKYSSFTKLIRVTAWCVRFVNNASKGRFNERQVNEEQVIGKTIVTNEYLTEKELRYAKYLWTRYVQQKDFPEVIDAIDQNKSHPIKNSLGVIKDENGILRCQGRFRRTYNSPKLLPKSSHFTNLVIKKGYKKLMHAGVSQTLSEARNEFWIIQGRSAVRKVLRQCLICIFWEGGPFKTPKFAPLPDYVISCQNQPFSFIGIDYLGPLTIQCESDLTKNWVCLFTCINVRAIHLELVQDMTTESFLMCIRRYIAQRGKPMMVLSDNAGQFKLGNAVIGKLWGSIVTNSEVQSYVSNEGIAWKFITDYAPWQGGFYERLVGITKRSIRKSLGRCKVTGEQLRTLLAETEAIVNSRPLLYLDDDINSAEAITPSHFTSLNFRTGVPEIHDNFYPEETSLNVLLETWKKGQARLTNFWNIWSSEYLQALREKAAYHMKPIKGEIRREPKVGEIVLIKDQDLPRGRWKLAKIIGLIESETDGVTRAAKLVTPSGRNFKRPLRLLYPLEGASNVLHEIGTNEDSIQGRVINENTKNNLESDYPRNRRNAAIVARKKIRCNAIESLDGEC